MRSTTLPIARAPSTRRTALSPQLPVLSTAMATTMAAMTPLDAPVSATWSMARDITAGNAAPRIDEAATTAATTSMRRPSVRK